MRIHCTSQSNVCTTFWRLGFFPRNNYCIRQLPVYVYTHDVQERVSSYADYHQNYASSIVSFVRSRMYSHLSRTCRFLKVSNLFLFSLFPFFFSCIVANSLLLIVLHCIDDAINFVFFFCLLMPERAMRYHIMCMRTCCFVRIVCTEVQHDGVQHVNAYALHDEIRTRRRVLCALCAAAYAWKIFLIVHTYATYTLVYTRYVAVYIFIQYARAGNEWCCLRARVPMHAVSHSNVPPYTRSCTYRMFLL